MSVVQASQSDRRDMLEGRYYESFFVVFVKDAGSIHMKLVCVEKEIAHCDSTVAPRDPKKNTLLL